MEKRIELEKRARNANQITELNLDNCKGTNIVGLTDEYTALESLSLINVGLTTLKGFPKLCNLTKLELSDNRISNGLHYLTTSPNLQYLNLSGNKIKDLEALKPLEEFKSLTVLDLFNNEATQIENYREKIFKMLPSLKYLDGFDSNDVEALSEEGDEDEDIYEDESECEYSDERSEIDEEEVSNYEEDSDEEEVTGIPLAEVYNDDLEEDNVEWEEEEEESDDDDIEGDGEANESAVSVEQKDEEEVVEEDPQARGKKRKHDG